MNNKVIFIFLIVIFIFSGCSTPVKQKGNFPVRKSVKNPSQDNSSLATATSQESSLAKLEQQLQQLKSEIEILNKRQEAIINNLKEILYIVSRLYPNQK